MTIGSLVWWLVHRNAVGLAMVPSSSFNQINYFCFCYCSPEHDQLISRVTILYVIAFEYITLV